MKFLHLVLCPLMCSSVSWFILYGNLNTICILLLCENCINLNYVELVHSAFQVYYILLLLCLFILLIFDNLILKLQLKILICLLKKKLITGVAFGSAAVRLRYAEFGSAAVRLRGTEYQRAV